MDRCPSAAADSLKSDRLLRIRAQPDTLARPVEVLAMLADDATWWVAGSTALSATYNKTEFANLLSQVTPMAPKGLSVKPTALCAEGARVSVEAVSYGEFNNGRVDQNEYHFMMVIRNGKLVSVREYLDTEHVTATFVP